jgi:hypothetical protein
MAGGIRFLLPTITKPHLYSVHCLARAKVKAKEDQFTRHQTVERYRRLLRITVDQKRRDHLERLILEAQKKKKDAGDSDYQY